MSKNLAPQKSPLKKEYSTKDYVSEEIEGEDVIVIYPSPLSFGPAFFLFVIFGIFAVYTMIAFPWSVQEVDLSLFSFRLPLAALPAVLIGIYILHSMYDARYIIGPNYLRGVDGLLSLTKNDVVVEIEHIQGIEIHRNLWGRIVNTGQLAVGTAAHEEEEIIMKHIADPSRIRDIVLARRDMNED